jgi:small multidrug resistance pump
VGAALTKWLLLLAAISSEVAATLSLKGALSHSWLYVIVVVGYLASFALLGLVLRLGIPLGVAYGIWAALGVAGAALLSALLFAEEITALMGIGLVLVMVGVVVVEVGSQAANNRVVVSGEDGL